MATDASTVIRLKSNHTLASRRGSLTNAMTAGPAIARTNKMLDRDDRAIAKKM